MKGAVATRHVLKILGQNGWRRIRVNGSHAIYFKDGISVPIKVTKKKYPPVTYYSIMKITGLSFD